MRNIYVARRGSGPDRRIAAFKSASECADWVSERPDPEEWTTIIIKRDGRFVDGEE